MATYHCSVKHGSKGKGASASAKCDYVGREGKYTDKPDLEGETLNGNMPSWAEENPREFWKASDDNERANGRVYTEIEVALPREITAEQRKELVQGFVKAHLDGHPYTANIHKPEAALEGGEQPHAHIIFSERKSDGIERDKEQFFKRANTKEPAKGGCAKDRDWNDTGKVQEIRESWEQHYNRYSPEQVSCKSLKDQGIDREPEPHLGPKGTQTEKKNIQQERELNSIKREMQGLTKEIEAAQVQVVPVEKTESVNPSPVVVPVVPEPAQSEALPSLPVKETILIQQPAVDLPPESVEVGVAPPAAAPEPPAFDPDAQRKRLTQINKAMAQIDQRYTPTAEQIKADNVTRYPHLDGWKEAVKDVEAKTPDFDKKVQEWKKAGTEKGYSMDSTSMLRSSSHKAWQQEGKDLQAERDKLVEEKKHAVEQVKAWEHTIKRDGGSELRQEAGKQRDSDPEYQKLKVEKAAVNAAIRDDKKSEKDKDTGRDMERKR